MSKTTPLLLSCFHDLSAITAEDAAAPEWIHLLPAKSGGTIETRDDRGPFTLGDAQAFIKRSLEFAGGRLPIDENHAIDHAGPKGGPSPARGWIVGMEERDDGIWGQVEWNSSGRQLVEDRAYRGISPVIGSDAKKEMQVILRASLVNTPNIKNLTTLHMETTMDWMERLIGLLGLSAEATEEEVTAALEKKLAKPEGDDLDMHSALTPIAKALKLDGDADLETVLNAIEAAPAETDLHALQTEVTTLTTSLHTMRDETAKDKATAFVDGAIKAGRVGLPPARRDAYITRHMADPKGTEADVNAMPIMPGVALTADPHSFEPDFDIEDVDQITTHARAYQKKQADAGVTIDFATAVTAVTEDAV